MCVCVGRGGSAVAQPVVLPIKIPACSLSSPLARKGDHGIKGALLTESKHKTTELSEICRVNKFITL